jgi:hypothetical protein
MIKNFTKYQSLNVYGSVEIRMFIMSKNSTVPCCTNFDFCNEDVEVSQPQPPVCTGKSA